MALTYRLTKGSELTYAELDGNFTHLDSKIDSASLDNISSFSDVDDRLDSIALNYMTAARLPAYFQNGHAGNLLPSVDSSYDLGSANYKWKDLHLSGSTIFIGGTTIKASGGSIITGQPIEAELKIAAGAGLDVNDNVIVNNDTTGTNLTGGFMFQSNNAQKSGFNIVNQDQLGQLTVAMDANLNGSLINWEGAIRTGNLTTTAINTLDTNLTTAMSNTSANFSPLFVSGAGVDGSWLYDTTVSKNKFRENGNWETYIPLSTLKTAVAASTDFVDFQARIAAL